MSCGLAVAAVLLMSDPSGVAAQPVPPPTTLAEEPMYADIVSRSRALRDVVDSWIARGMADDAQFAHSEEFAGFQIAAAELSERDMAGHLDLRQRGTDGDLRCILRGLSEDLTVRVEALAAAGKLPQKLAADLIDSLHFFMGLKLKTGLQRLETGQAASDEIHLDKLSSLDRDLLKDTLGVVKQFKALLNLRFHLEAA